MADQAKGKGIAPKRASNPADLGQSSRPLPPIRTLLEDKEDGEDYSEVIEVLKQYIKSYKRVIASQSSDIKILLLSLNTLKASVKDSVSAIKNISSTLASLTNSSNAAAATTGKTSYSPRFDPLSGTMDLDSPPHPPRKEPYLGPAVNSATSNLDPPIDRYSRPIESKKEDVYNEFHALTFSTYKKGLSAFNAEFYSYLAKLTMAKIDIDLSLILNQNPAIEAYRAAYIANSSNSTPNSNSNPSKKAIEEEEESDSSSNSSQLRPINTGNSPVSPASIGSITLEVLSRKAPPTYTKLGGCLIKETLYRGDRRCIAVLDFKKSGFFLDVKGSSKPILHANFAFPLGLTSYNTIKSIELQCNKIVVEIASNSIRKEDYRPIIEDTIVSEAIEPNKRYKLRNSLAKGTTLEGIGPSLRGKRPYRPTREPKPLTGTRDLPYILRELVIEGNKVEKAISSPTLKEPNIGQRDYYNLPNLAKLWHVRLGHIGLRLLKKTSSITKGLSNFDKIKEADFHCSSYNRGKAVRRVSKSLIYNPPRVLDLIEGDTVKIRPRPYNRNPIVLLLVDRKSRYRWVFNLPYKSGPIVANAIKGFFRGLRNSFGRYPTKFHFDRGTKITDLLTTWLAKRGIKFSTSAPYIHEQNGLVERLCFILEAIVELVNSTAITNKETTPFQALFYELEPEGELVDLDLDLEGAVSLDPSNLNTEKPISIEIGSSKLEPYKSSSNSELDKPLLDKPINPVIVESTRPTISIRKPELPEAFPETIEPIFVPKPREVIAPNQLITNEPLDNSNLISEGDKMQLDYYKLLAKTSSYILSFVYKARKRVISKDSMPTTYKQVLKLPRDKRSKWLEAITKEFI
ncbi:hypothetical protein P8C59_008398 [Phyllachora maydis]|uniref:Integrase catalytic domain-containing protein n=1 Tax=Phyllachora maydis TaxID=1825666 RepID=A0AAD9IAM9_9PEZI|nr:hypothetical protein P8C59_008398 [Phyllachora maydis]